MPRHPANFHSVAQVLWPNRVPMRLEPEKPLGSAQSSGLTQFEAPRTPRPTRKLSKSGTLQALETIREAVNAGWRHVLDADIRDYFGSIDQMLLMESVSKRVCDRRVLKLLR